MLRLSRFATFFPLAEGRFALVSNLNGAMAVVNGSVREALESLPLDPERLEGDLAAQLRQKGFLVEGGSGEEERWAEVLTSYRTWEPSIWMVLTYACNCRCIYCYEGEGDSRRMTRDVLLRSLEVAAEHFQPVSRPGRNMAMIFYGGEPLLNPDLMLTAVEEAERIFGPGINWRNSVVTNGTLLGSEAAELLRRCHCRAAYLTLDGPPELHDRRRPFKTGRGSSFAATLDGIARLLEAGLNPVIRINVDRENLPFVPQLLEILAAAGLCRERVSLFFYPVEPISPDCQGYGNDCLPPPEYAASILPLYQTAIERGFTLVFDWVRWNPLFCHAVKPYSLAFDPVGDIYKCTTGLRRPEFVVGNVFCQPPLNERYRLWADFNPLQRESCRECDILGFCGGGCLAMAYATAGDFTATYCPYRKHGFGRALEQYLRVKQKSKGQLLGGIPARLT